MGVCARAGPGRFPPSLFRYSLPGGLPGARPSHHVQPHAGAARLPPPHLRRRRAPSPGPASVRARETRSLGRASFWVHRLLRCTSSPVVSRRGCLRGRVDAPEGMISPTLSHDISCLPRRVFKFLSLGKTIAVHFALRFSLCVCVMHP